jgi:hypothetical protein
MSDPNKMAAALAMVTDMLAPMREAVIGYRRSLIDAGLDPEAASACAADFHHLVVTQVLAQSGKQTK